MSAVAVVFLKRFYQDNLRQDLLFRVGICVLQRNLIAICYLLRDFVFRIFSHVIWAEENVIAVAVNANALPRALHAGLEFAGTRSHLRLQIAKQTLLGVGAGAAGLPTHGQLIAGGAGVRVHVTRR